MSAPKTLIRLIRRLGLEPRSGPLLWYSLTLSAILLVLAALPAGAQSPECESGLIAHLAFDGNVSDDSGNLNDGIPFNLSFEPGVFDQAARFNGSARVEIPNPSILPQGDEFTISVWAKFDALDFDRTIIDKRQDRDGTKNVAKLQINDGNASLNFNTSDVNHMETQTLYPISQLDTCCWHMITGVYDYPLMWLYIDGVLVDQAVAPAPLNTTTANLWIGLKDEPGDPDPFLGLLDDLRIFDRALNEAEILGLLNGCQEPCADLDDDGYGAPGNAQCRAGQEADCDDSDPWVNPDAQEVCNGRDDDCDGSLLVDEVDIDHDGALLCAGDCDDLDCATYPGAAEVYDGQDNDCDGLIDEGLDDDGDGIPNFRDVCAETPLGSGVGPDGCGLCALDPDDDQDGFPASVDCDDANPTVNPGAVETCNGIDDDCNAWVDEGFDQDGDGFVSCDGPEGPGDCNDSDASINPTAIELPGNATDENCDGDLGSCDPCSDWQNHGEYVRCVAHEAEALAETGAISEDQADALVTSAAHSKIGKKDFVPDWCQ